MGIQPNIQVLSHPATAWARSNAVLFFASGAASVEELLEQLSRGARVLGGTAVETKRLGDWFIVAAQVDWFANGRHPVSEDLLFKRPEAFPELGQNCTRPEFVVAAFAEEVVVANPDGAYSLSGLVQPDECGRVLTAATPGFKRAVAFKGLRASVAGGAESAMMDSTRPAAGVRDRPPMDELAGNRTKS
jgi:hypothetical protein